MHGSIKYETVVGNFPSWKGFAECPESMYIRKHGDTAERLREMKQ